MCFSNQQSLFHSRQGKRIPWSNQLEINFRSLGWPQCEQIALCYSTNKPLPTLLSNMYVENILNVKYLKLLINL